MGGVLLLLFFGFFFFLCVFFFGGGGGEGTDAPNMLFMKEVGPISLSLSLERKRKRGVSAQAGRRTERGGHVPM